MGLLKWIVNNRSGISYIL